MKNNVLKMLELIDEAIIRAYEEKRKQPDPVRVFWESGYIAGLENARDVLLNNSKY